MLACHEDNLYIHSEFKTQLSMENDFISLVIQKLPLK